MINNLKIGYLTHNIRLEIMYKCFNFKLNSRMQEEIAGMIATGNKEHVIGVALRAFVAGKVGLTLQMDVMALSAAKEITNVFYDQVSEFCEVVT